MLITSKGQLTIPQEVRKRLGLLPHTEVEFEIILLDIATNDPRWGERSEKMPDFYIGEHAAVKGLALLTRDVSRYRTGRISPASQYFCRQREDRYCITPDSPFRRARRAYRRSF